MNFNFILIFILILETYSFDKFQYVSSRVPVLPKKVIYKKSKLTYELPFYENKFLKNKESIYLYPAGLRGYYDLGTVAFLKEFYDLNEYVICGASAGAWNSLALNYKGNTGHFCMRILNQIGNNFTGNSVYEQQLFLKDFIINNYKFEDFNMNYTYVSVTVRNENRFYSYLYKDFDDIEDWLNCCMASSNIPLITGPRKLIYDNKCVFDGGFNREPFFDTLKTKLHIRYNLWENEELANDNYSIKNLDVEKSFISGYNDCLKNKKKLDKLFK